MSDPGEEVAASTRDRVVAAALRCLAAEGLRRTTVDDVAVEAGISRATLYRAFPGGRDTIVAVVVDAELESLTATIEGAVEGAADLREALASTINVAAMFAANARIHGITVGSREMFEDMTRAIESLDIRPVVDRRFPLEQAPAAFRAMKAGEHFGKIVLTF